VNDYNIQKIKVPPGYEVQSIYEHEIVCPWDVAIGPNGDMFVIESGVDRILKVSPNGTVSVYMNIPLSQPLVGTLAINKKGDIFVSTGEDTILKISPDKKITTLASNLQYIDELTVGPSGDLYASSIGWDGGPNHDESKIFKISTETGELSIFTTEVLGAYDMEFSPSGELYVTELGTGSILKFDSDGKMTKLIGGIQRMDSIHISFGKDGYLYLLHTGSGFLRISPDDGTYTSLDDVFWSLPPGDWGDFVFDDSGDMILLGSTRSFIGKVSLDTKEIEFFVHGFSSRGLAIGPDGAVYVGDIGNCPVLPSRILRIDKDGNMSEFAAGFGNHLWDLTFDSEGNLYVSELDGRISKIAPDGNISIFFSEPREDPTEIISMSFNPKSGELYGLDMRTGRVVKITSEQVIPVSMEFFNGAIMDSGGIAFDQNGTLYALIGQREELPQNEKEPSGLGTVKVRVYKITPDNRVAELFNLDKKDAPPGMGDIVINPVGDIYVLVGHFPRLGQTKIWQLSPQGDISIFAEDVQALNDPTVIGIDNKGTVYFPSAAGVFKIVKVEENSASGSTPLQGSLLDTTSTLTPSTPSSSSTPTTPSSIIPLIMVNIIVIAVILGIFWVFKRRMKSRK